MHRVLIILALMATAASIPAEETPTAPQHLSRKQLRSMTAGAVSGEQCQSLADYYAAEAKRYGELASAQKAEWERCNRASLGTKYPSASERARTLWLHYSARSQTALDQSREWLAHKESQRASEQGGSGRTGTSSQ